MPQLQAGYFINGIFESFTKTEKFKNLLNSLSYFELNTESELRTINPDPIAVVIDKIISRGLPTFPSTFIEDRISTTFIKTKKVQENNTFHYNFINEELKDEIIRSLHIIDPRFSIKNIPDNYFENNKNLKQLITNFIPQNVGDFFVQLISKNRNLSDIINNIPKKQNIDINNEKLLSEKFDLSIELPYSTNNIKGLPIKFDTQLNQINKDYLYTDKLNEFLKKLDWAELAEIKNFNNPQDIENQKIIDFTFNEYFDILSKNYKSPLYNNEYGLNALQIALTPLAVARIQKTILQFILSEELDLNASSWNIAVIERDVPAAFLAIEDLNHHFEKLFILENNKRKLPKINLTIYYTSEFENAELNILYQGKIFPIEEFDSNETYDLLIDLSILRRNNFDFEPINTSSISVAKIRSIEYINSTRVFLTNQNINYKLHFFENTPKTTAQKDLENQTKECLNFFLKNIFHINNITYHQHKIFSKILANNNTLSVLNSTENKCVIYKLASLLQPGNTIIIVPIMAGLKYQFDELFKNKIDANSYFSASTQNIHDKYLALNKLQNSQSIFNFVTPDRLHIPDYRQAVTQLQSNNVNISYIVVDEAHCSSEWSHDFRVLYSTISNNFKLLFAKNNIPKYACFTETASYDVIENIKILYSISTENIVKLEPNFENVQLKFIDIIDYETNTEESYDITLKNNKLLNIRIPEEHKSIIFDYYPEQVADKIEAKNISLKIFSGSIGDKLHSISTIRSRNSYKNLLDFINNETNVLLSVYSLTIGCKAKTDLVYLLNLPVSVESFVQILNSFSKNNKTLFKVLYSSKKYHTTETTIEFDSTGELLEKQFSTEIFIEDIERQQAYNTLNINAKKELQILNEILNNISYPSETIKDVLIRRIRYAFDKWVKIESQPQYNPTKLYVYDTDNEIIGYLDFENNQLNTTNLSSKKELAFQILSLLKFDINKIVSSEIEIFSLLDDNISVHENNGINNIWTSLKNNEQATLTVEFYNNAAKNLVNKFISELKKEITLNNIIDIYEISKNFKEFSNNFTNIFNLEKESYNQIYNDLQFVYLNFRNFFDTLQAIQKLFATSIINDFIIDYQNQQFTLIFSKKNDTEIINNVYQKILPFVTKNKAFEVYEKIPHAKGNSNIAKALHFYEYFYFTNILQKRKDSFDFISQIIHKFSNSEENIKPILNYYFTAKYLFKLEENRNSDFDFIKTVFEDKNLFIDDFFHLHKSAELLLNTNSDNHNYYIINGLSGIIAYSDYDTKLLESIDNLTIGINLYRNKYTKVKFNSYFTWIINVISEYNLELRNKIESLITLKIHKYWLTTINKKLNSIFPKL